MPNRRFPIPVNELVDRYEAGEPMAALARAYRCSDTVIKNRLVEAGVPLRPGKRAGRDLTGMTFERLTANFWTGKSTKHNRERIWSCTCVCGAVIEVTSGNLVSGNTVSCGCLHDEKTEEAGRTKLIGVRSGCLVALEWSGTKDSAGSYLWRCRCDCGAEVMVSSYNINKQHVISCGCVRQTKAAKRPEKVRRAKVMHQGTRRARENSAGGSFTEAQIEALYYKQGKKCAVCRCKLKLWEFERDHVVPLSRGGSNDIKNIQITCGSCNRKKRSKDPIVFARERGFLL